MGTSLQVTTRRSGQARAAPETKGPVRPDQPMAKNSIKQKATMVQPPVKKRTVETAVPKRTVETAVSPRGRAATPAARNAPTKGQTAETPEEIAQGSQRRHVTWSAPFNEEVYSPVDEEPEPEEQQVEVKESKATQLIKLLHKRSGHRSAHYLKRAVELGLLPPLILKGHLDGAQCDSCQTSKHARRSPPKTVQRLPAKLGETWHSDVCGPYPVESLERGHYVIGYIDQKSRWMMAHIITHKFEVAEKFQEFVKEVKILMPGATIYRLHTDSGGEYTSTAFEAQLKNAGIRLTTPPPRTPEGNGIIEVHWRLVNNMVRAFLADSGLDKELWGELVGTAIYLLNRFPTNALGGDTPYHVVKGHHAPLNHLRTIGCRAYARYPPSYQNKLSPKAWMGILVGYDEPPGCYRIFDPGGRKVYRTRDVTFNERVFPAKLTSPDDDLEELLPAPPVRQRAPLPPALPPGGEEELPAVAPRGGGEREQQPPPRQAAPRRDQGVEETKVNRVPEPQPPPPPPREVAEREDVLPPRRETRASRRADSAQKETHEPSSVGASGSGGAPGASSSVGASGSVGASSTAPASGSGSSAPSSRGRERASKFCSHPSYFFQMFSLTHYKPSSARTRLFRIGKPIRHQGLFIIFEELL